MKRSAMAKTIPQQGYDPVLFAHNMAQAAHEWQLIIQMLMEGSDSASALAQERDLLNISNAFMDAIGKLASDPARLMNLQVSFWQDYMHMWQQSVEKFFGHEKAPTVTPAKTDRRFKDPAWEESAIFDFIKQSYMVSARWLRETMRSVHDIDPKTAQKIDFYARQYIDAVAPTNFFLTNPEVLKTTLDSNGENLMRGLKNMRVDIERGRGKLAVSTTDKTKFSLGENLATTPGEVVFQNDLMQLIQYTPATKQVHEIPLLLIPAWINKYYIFDMQPENSLIKWLVSQGYTVFCVSWVNPDDTLKEKTFADYMQEGPLTAIDVIREITGAPQVSCMGYCLGGTLLAITLAYLHAKGQESVVASATYLTTMINFSEPGELGVFIDEEQLRSLEDRMDEKGYLEGREMATTFSMLRANDLIWSFVVNNYLLGKDPFPFDLLYWNDDSTRMPAKMHSFYLRNMYQRNRLIVPGGITVDDISINLHTIETPTYILSCREDHIAPWRSTFDSTGIYDGDVTFVLSGSGHIAGVINPPSKNKYPFWTQDVKPGMTADKWLEGAAETSGSWWPHWDMWQQQFAGDNVKARKPGSAGYKPIEDAPGSYVKVKSE
ncbi:MAG: class I poly(R)-hydroxyalkanoic acid synthase [Rickettsiales bacterium]